MNQIALPDILCACLREAEDSALVDHLARFSDTDWVGLLTLANHLHVEPLLYHHLTTSHPYAPVPASIRQQLHASYLINAARNTWIYQELHVILAALQQAQIPVIVLKGGYLAEQMYQNVALRTMTDLDLLFRKGDVSRAQRVLLQIPYASSAPRVPIELHWNLNLSMTDLPIDMEAVWARAQPVILAGVDTLALTPEDMLLHLGIHAAFHHLFQNIGLRAFCDVRQLLQQAADALDWDVVGQRAQMWGSGRVMAITLQLTHDLLHATIPEEARTALASVSLDPQGIAHVREQLFHELDAGELFSPYFWQLWQPESWGKKMHILRKLLFPEAAMIAQTYPSSIGGLRQAWFRGVRVKDHLRPYSAMIWRMLVGDATARALFERQQQQFALRTWLSDKL